MGRLFEGSPTGYFLAQAIREGHRMAAQHTAADDIVYDIVSIQYHAMQAAESYLEYLNDAHAEEHADVTEFIKECLEQDNRRAQRCHELLKDLTAERSGIG